MIFDNKTKNECLIFIFDAFQRDKQVNIEEVIPKRTSRQNRALHLFFKMISDELNNIGLDFNYQGIKGMDLSCRYTEKIVKDFIWKPMQKILFDIDSTTKINTNQINEILDILTKFFGERNIPITFPNEFDAYLKIIK